MGASTHSDDGRQGSGDAGAGDAGGARDAGDVGEAGADAAGVRLSPVAGLLAEALELAERDGAGAIDAACARHPEHAAELRRRFTALAELGLVQQPRTFGYYRVLRTLGQGGMGIVYLARDERLQRLVALKALPARLSDNARALARFQREIKAVAQLRHPGIVPIYAMDTEGGVPFFTMEHIEGRTLADIVAGTCALGIAPDRLTPQHLAPQSPSRSWVEAVCRVALDVAEALQHAHEHGIVHRDVKPGNVLVRPDGRALLFDFGLARAEDDAGLTLTGDFAGTPYYVSPEQVSAGAHAAGGADAPLDGRTDVYSLGVSLYELLTLQRPFDGKSSDQVFRQIESREPDLPRRANPAVPRDLQTICLTALEKDPGRRYQTAADMAADLRALLEFRPVRARPVGRLLRAGRLVRRHPARATAAILAALLLVGTPVGLGVANVAIREQREDALAQARRANVEADRANAEADRANAEAVKAQAALVKSINRTAQADRTLEFLVSVLTSVDPLRDDRNLPMVDVLRRAAEELGPALMSEPHMESMVRQNIGLTFRNLGLYAEAEAQFRRAIEVAAPADVPDRDYLTALALNNLAVVLARTDRLREAQATMLQALALGGRVPSIGAAHYTQFLSNAAFIRMLDGDRISARLGYEDVLRRLRELYPEDHPRVVEALLNVAANTPDPAQAEALNRQALALQERTLAPDDPQLALTLGNLAIGRFLQDDAAQAEALQARALSILRSRLGDQHVEVLNAQVVLGIVRGHLGRHAEAAALIESSLAGFRAVYPAGHSRVVTAMRQLAEEWQALGRDADSIPLLRDALAMQTRVNAGDDQALEACRGALRSALQRLGRDAEANELLPSGS